LTVRDKKATRARDEVEAIIRGFTVADWARLYLLGKSLAFKTKWDSDDLIQEAILRTLRGTRNCPSDIDVMKHLVDTMSSVADGEREKAHNQIVHVPTLQPGTDEAECDPSSQEWSAEEALVYEAGREEILAAFDDDPTARDLVDGILARFDTDQLKELTGLQGTAYDTKRTLVRRRLLKLFPRGKTA
jgi:DNA-directed RNA polymerase specialized sigma24 family protein